MVITLSRMVEKKKKMRRKSLQINLTIPLTKKFLQIYMRKHFSFYFQIWFFFYSGKKKNYRYH